MDEESVIQGHLQRAYEQLKASDISSALNSLEKALEIDYEHPEVVFALKCVNWWLERFKVLPEGDGAYEKGEYLVSQWKQFQSFVERMGNRYDRCLYGIRQGVFHRALVFFTGLLKEGVEQVDAELLLQLGRCYKALGDYEKAQRLLEEALGQKQEDAEILAELADVYALVNEPRLAKVLFREAFFINPQKIDIRLMESEFILVLYRKVKELGYKSPELEEWLPVYGVLWGIFTIKRELRAIELGKLKQSIFSLENEIRANPEKASLLVPRLINRYFWLIDHYVNAGEDQSRIEETLLKIKILDPVVYDRFEQ